ncbi:MAG: rhodanese-like domain-containing protein [Rufibacter sp.]
MPALDLQAQNNPEPWKSSQLMAPAELAKILKEENRIKTYVYNIGPAGYIKDAIDIGDGRDPESVQKLKKEVAKLPKDAQIVLYCGCCPFKNCPNVRPTFQLLNEMGFTHHRLLNLANNLKVDWIDKGYPMRR